MKTTHRRKSHESVLVTAAESIGSALGSIAAKADAAQESITKYHLVDKLEGAGKKIIRKTRGSVINTTPGRKPGKLRPRATKHSKTTKPNADRK